MTGPPMLKAAGLWKRTSAKGADYFAGRLGGVKIVILENRDRQAEGAPTHWLYFAEPTNPTSSSAQRPHDGAGAAGRSPKRSPHSMPQQSTCASGMELPNDPVTDLWAGPAPR
jgi:hypothetical protein